MTTPSFLATYRVWRGEHARIMAERDALVIRQLLKLAPKRLHRFLKDQCELKRIPEFGGGGGDFVWDGLERYFKDPAHFKKRMKVLAKAWQGLVDVKITHHNDSLLLELTIIS
ncbi:MAG: hypothetical protein E6R05_06115 [Candidatus Moraniibacteriota bacterium]|nr:MAG: hypothetical protein E6R05_06115 [Candidatus Moranbacteria bacterium]